MQARHSERDQAGSLLPPSGKTNYIREENFKTQKNPAEAGFF
jgi:hypothetical protein